jgi:hypothetical protein
MIPILSPLMLVHQDHRRGRGQRVVAFQLDMCVCVWCARVGRWTRENTRWTVGGLAPGAWLCLRKVGLVIILVYGM